METFKAQRYNPVVRDYLYCRTWYKQASLYLTSDKKPDSEPVIIPYKVMNRLYTTLYGIIEMVTVRKVFAIEV